MGRPGFLDTVQYLVRKPKILGGPTRMGSERKDGFLVSWTFLKTHIFGNNRLKDFWSENALDLLMNIFGQHGSFVMQRDQNSQNFQIRIGTSFHAFNGL